MDLTGFNDNDEGVAEAEITLNGILSTLTELRKAQKAASILSMRALIANLQEEIDANRGSLRGKKTMSETTARMCGLGLPRASQPCLASRRNHQS